LTLKRSARYGKADIKYTVAARADKKPFGCSAVFFKDAVKTIFIAAIRAILELVLHLDLFYFSIHYITCFTQRAIIDRIYKIDMIKNNPEYLVNSV
jgi:hypothetical protein